MFIVVKKKVLIIVAVVLCLAVAAVGITVGVCRANAGAAPNAVVVIDAGHGGVDNGAKGVQSGVTEKELNLAIALLVKERLEKNNVRVVLTRENDEGLYGEEIKNFKKADMAKRKEIINSAQPNLVVSIHGNKFPDSTRRGAQVFYDSRSESGKELATLLQNSLNTLNVEKTGKSFETLDGDYYILKCSPYPSAIVEYGFLSNAEDDALLQTDEYRNAVAAAIYEGISGYLAKNVAAVAATYVF